MIGVQKGNNVPGSPFVKNRAMLVMFLILIISPLLTSEREQSFQYNMYGICERTHMTAINRPKTSMAQQTCHPVLFFLSPVVIILPTTLTGTTAEAKWHGTYVPSDGPTHGTFWEAGSHLDPAAESSAGRPSAAPPLTGRRTWGGLRLRLPKSSSLGIPHLPPHSRWTRQEGNAA